MNSQSEIEINKKVGKLKTLKIKRRNFLESKLQNISWSKYKSKCEDLVKIFDKVPDSEKLIYDCTCALQKDILYQGRLYICLTGFYFHAQVFMKDTMLVLKWNDVLTMKRSKTAKFFPNAILIESKNGQVFLTSFGSRDKTFLLMHRLWQCAINHNEMSMPEMNLWMRYYYRDPNLGDGSRVASPHNQKQFLKKIQNQLKLVHQHFSDDVIQRLTPTFARKARVNLSSLSSHSPMRPLTPELQLSGKEKFEDRRQSDCHGAPGGSSLPSIPPPVDASIADDDGEVFSEDSKVIAPKSNSPFLKSKRNGIFPLKKSRSRSFEHLGRELGKVEDPSRGSKDVGKEKEERNKEDGKILDRDPPDDGSEESGRDSDTPYSKCCGHSHLPILVLDETLNLSADKVFQLCFSDSELYRDFVNSKKTSVCQCGEHEELPEVLLDNVYPVNANVLFKQMFHKRCFWSKVLELRGAKDVVLSPWTTESDGSGARVRNIAYTLSLNYPFSPKHSLTTEKQVLHADSSPGEFYLVDTECVNNGLPYGEDFYIVNRYCISKMSESSSRIRITSQIKYRKKVWGLIKSFIDKNATAGILETFSIMGHLLRKQADRADDSPELITNDDVPASKNSLRRKIMDRPFSNPEKALSDENQCNNFQEGPASATKCYRSVIVKDFVDSVRRKHDQRWFFNLTFAQAVHLVTAFALVLCIFNIFLYFKMHSLESVTSQFEAQLQQDSRILDTNNCNKLLSSPEQLEGADDVKRWKDTMSSLVLMMEDVAHSISQLEQILAPKVKAKG